jgi:DNA-binding GntR family transcriptional regulator
VQNLGKVPSNRDIARHLDVSESSVRRAISANEAEWKRVREGLQ